MNNGNGKNTLIEISNPYGQFVSLQPELRITLKLVLVRLESVKAVNMHEPMLYAYTFADAVEVVSEVYITVFLNLCFRR